MVSPSYQERICEMFDFFCKTVSRNYYRDLLRAEKRRNDHYKEEPADYLFELLGHKDAYPSDSFVLDADGHSCVVESETLYEAHMDLEKFFDTVSQSKLIEVLSRTVKDGRVISLIHKYLNAGVVANGKFERTVIGMPQDGSLSTLVSNVMLNELNKELERSGQTMPLRRRLYDFL